MKTLQQFFINRWREKLGYKPLEFKPMPDIESLKKSEWDEEFETLRKNRMVMGAFRYGLIAKQNLDEYDWVQQIKDRVDRYAEDGNLEHLIDAGNCCMLGFIDGKRKGKELLSIDDGIHNKPKK
jgi:hypothetical protein